MSISRSKKDLKKINIKMPIGLTAFKPDIETLLDKNEKIIKDYLENFVYVSNLNLEINEKVKSIFEKTNKDILDKL